MLPVPPRAPVVPPSPTRTVPPWMETAPAKVLLEVKVTVPVLVLVSEPMPPMPPPETV